MDPLSTPVSFWWAVGLGLLLMTGELLVPATVFLWTGVACLLVALPLALIPDFTLLSALLVWMVLSVALVVAAKLYNKGHLASGDRYKAEVPPNRYGNEFVGMTTTLKKDSSEGQARVDLKGANWGVKLPKGDLKAGAKIKITAVDGIYLVGEPVD
ncbi:MAG TPA: NfeD family protein [bacterium]|nr:NfeD family protein [bacterium]